jgi:hypothetical protein
MSSSHSVERVVEAVGERKLADRIAAQPAAFRAGDDDLIALADQVAEGRHAVAGHGPI